MWFRNDLRVHDNPALVEAARYVRSNQSRQPGSQLFGIIFQSPYEQRQVHHWGLAKADYYLQNIKVLCTTLNDLGISLIFHSIPEQKWPRQVDYFAHLGREIIRVALANGCSALFYNEEYDGPSIDRDKQVQMACETAGIAVHTTHDQCAVPVGKVLTKMGAPHKVFSQFKRGWVTHIVEHGLNVLEAPTAFNNPKVGPIGDIPDMPQGYDLSEWPDLNLIKVREMFPAGEKAAMTRLKDFLSVGVSNYQEDRNLYMENSASKMSAPLAIGSISLKQCLLAAKSANKGQLTNGHSGIVHWINELCWRDFYRHVLVGFPHVGYGHAFRPEYELLPWRAWPGGDESEQAEEDFKRWCEGRTGVPIVDAAMRQLRQEAWQNNRVRMVVAMYLTKDLLIHWRRGERFFMEHLIDFDYSSNNGGWQWSASTGTDAQPYFRVFNPLLQSEKFDPSGKYICKYIPELKGLKAHAVHEPHTRTTKTLFEQLNYPAPIVDHMKARARVLSMFAAVKDTAGIKNGDSADSEKSKRQKRTKRS